MSFAPLSNLLLAQTDSTAGRVVYELSRLHDYDDNRLPLALLAVAVVVIASLVLFLYRRDTVELSRGLRILLAGLRFIALAGLLVFFLGIERRTNREVVHNSQVAVLVDVSQSMALNEGNAAESAKPTSRLDEVVATLAKSPLVEELRREHDVHVARFDKEVQPIVSLPKITAEKSQQPDTIDNGPPGSPTNPAEQPAVDWSAELTASGTETRLGDALDEQFRLYRNSPLAGVVVISDGAQNAGMEPSAAVEAAQQAKVPIFTIGVGSAQPRRNVAVSDFLVPSRAFPRRFGDDHWFLAGDRLRGAVYRRRIAAARGGRSGRRRHLGRNPAGCARRRWRDRAGDVRNQAGRAETLCVSVPSRCAGG